MTNKGLRLKSLKNIKLTILLVFYFLTANSQNEIEIQGVLDVENNTILIKQKITYYNNSETSLSELYFNDWGSSFSNPDSPLSKRFVEEYNGSLLNPRQKNRGLTTIHSVENENHKRLSYSYLENECDLFKIKLDADLLPFTSTSLYIEYTLQIQSDRFTKYGVTNKGDYFLNYWYLTPAVYENSEWKLYSNKNLDDYYTPKSKLKLTLEIPYNYSATSELNLNKIRNKPNTHEFTFEGNNRMDTRLNISKDPFLKFKIGNLNIISNSLDEDESLGKQINSFEKVIGFLNARLGMYPHENLMISKVDLKKHPVYGLNLLPGFLSPFSKEFEYELTVAKNLIRLYLDEYLRMNPREDHWLKSGFETVLLMDYVDKYYKDQKILGTLANVWGIKTYNLAKLKYNEQYQLTYLYMVRTGRDQALNLQKDELLKFNANLTTKYKAAKGLIFLEDLIEGSKIEDWIKEFIVENKNDFKTTKDFELYIKTKTSKDLSWFFESFLTNTKQIDYKITTLKRSKDSIYFTVKNNKKGQTPVSLFTLKDGKVLTKTWLTDIGKEKDFVVANNSADKFVLNYDQKVPEFNVKNNWKSVKGSALFNRPFQLRLIKDYVSPYNNQLYLLPTLEYRNIYDGLNLGLNINNSGILKKPFTFGVAPNYSVNSKTLTGFTKFKYNSYFEDQDLYNIEFGVFMSRSSFAENSFVTRTQPFISFNFKDAKNLRSNKFESLKFRYVGIDKDYVETVEDKMALPSYGVFNIRYLNSNRGYKKHYSWFLDSQFSNQFGKIAFNYEIRKRTNKNSFYDLRIFAGSFLYSNIEPNQTYFDFALDRPTDYLFEYNYLGQFESTGIFSQQIIIAEGGFKSRLETYYANQWLTTLNASASIWNYVQAYGDVGFLKNKGKKAEFIYDSGIRLNLITNYFEIFFPVYSNLGWEIAAPQYSQKIRFIFTADPSALLGLFRREWY